MQVGYRLCRYARTLNIATLAGPDIRMASSGETLWPRPGWVREEVEVVETSDGENCAFASVVLSGGRESAGGGMTYRDVVYADV